MIVNVEFFDENQIENLVTSLNYKVDKTLFLGHENMLEENKRCIEKFLKNICGAQEVEFCIVDDVDLAEIMNVISNVVNHELELGNEVFFDLTGGESLPLVAFGIISKELMAPMHMYDIQSNKMYEYGYEGSSLLSELAEYDPISLNLDGFISLYGGTINYRMHKNFKDTWSDEDIKDVVDMWNLSRNYKTKWVHYSALLRKFMPDDRLNVQVEAKQFITEINKNKMLGSIATFNQFLDACESAGFLKYVCHENGVYSYTYKNESIKNYF